MPALLPDETELVRYGSLLAEARRVKGTSLGRDAWRKLKRNRVATTALVVLATLATLAVFVPLYAVSYPSPTMGCNSCHNVRAGTRMGLPPETFKDRTVNPNLKNNTFMVEHWFYPQVVW